MPATRFQLLPRLPPPPPPPRAPHLGARTERENKKKQENRPLLTTLPGTGQRQQLRQRARPPRRNDSGLFFSLLCLLI